MTTQSLPPRFDGTRLRALRKQRGLSTDALARLTTLTARHLWRLEGGQRPHVAAVTLARLARTLQTSVDYLVGLTDNPAPPVPLAEQEFPANPAS